LSLVFTMTRITEQVRKKILHSYYGEIGIFYRKLAKLMKENPSIPRSYDPLSDIGAI